MEPVDKVTPMRLVFTVTLEDADFNATLTPSKNRALLQAVAGGLLLEQGAVFNDLGVATDQAAPPEMFEMIENLFPVVGRLLRDVRTGAKTPYIHETRFVNNDTGEIIGTKPAKLDS